MTFRRNYKITRDEVVAILLAEYAYWRDAEDQSADSSAIHLGAMASVSNVLAALEGYPVEWHPKPASVSNFDRVVQWFSRVKGAFRR